ncbi:hypothetical protein Mspyr1_49650 [Mycolicibacterium gilvum Spyr1]|uniref:Uncharacterized protein n=1 Tax=Mycolicibacterium gilvum (strain DSM 45189 / LMG 24558 / Spyr1) TaxID=278137 RepID=E6TKN4_MYCSR|nr:hypothetical protein Mspyr1_49650 [Mycolicibacterium gilvum Spyr1]
MGRHSLSYVTELQECSSAPVRRSTAGHVGRVGLLAVALGIGAAAVGGTAVAGADTESSNSARSSAVSAKPSTDRTADDSADTSQRGGSRADDDPASAPTTALAGVRRDAEDTPDADDPDAGDVAAAKAAVEADADDDAADGDAAEGDAAAPDPDDQVDTEYGDIGKWMLDSRGEIADYGGLPYEGRTVLEPVNVVIVDSRSRSTLEATWRLNAAMWRAGFPPRLIHSTGFRGLIDSQLYRQQPRGLLVGYSDAFFLLPNNHGRIFGPDPVETSSGYVWSGAFSTEEFVFYQGLPRHAYVSGNDARDALAAKLVTSGRATLGTPVSLENSYNTDTVTTGDHDGYAAVLMLNNLTTFAASASASDSRRCAPASYFAVAGSSCAAPGVPAESGSR